MRKHIAIVSVIIAELLLYPTAIPARSIEDWPYEKLFKKSTLVVFATALKTEAADDKWSPYPSAWPYEFAAQNTTFKVNHALKGQVDGEEIKVLHFKFEDLKKKHLDPKSPTIINGPYFVAFRNKPLTVTEGNSQRVLPKPEYLLFLAKGLDGRYEPVSGRIDPVLSVKEVFEAPNTLFGDK